MNGIFHNKLKSFNIWAIREIDLFPTLAALTGHELPSDIDGESLIEGIVEGLSLNPNKEIYSEFHKDYSDRMVIQGKWKYVYAHQRTAQLYDLYQDPGELNNLAGSPLYAEIEQALRDKVLKGWVFT